MTHRGPFQPLPFCVILCDSVSYGLTHISPELSVYQPLVA